MLTQIKKQEMTIDVLQQRLISINTALFCGIKFDKPLYSEDPQLKNYLTVWNDLLHNKIPIFFNNFVENITNELKKSMLVRSIYQGEYDNALEDLKVLLEIDEKTIKFIDDARKLHKNENNNNQAAITKFYDSCVKYIEEYALPILVEIQERCTSLTLLPEKYFSTLPENAASVIGNTC